jgi:xanthine dehydrogenase FAD-binding subunit
MSIWKRYIVAHSLPEAIDALAAASGPARPVAGGTDLLLELQQGHHSPIDTLVDITSIPELTCLEIRGSELFIGAAVPVSEVSESPLVRRHALAVAEGCALIGGPQVRNTATLGGNVAHALPAADGMIGLLALDAQVEIAAAGGLRRVPILSLFRGPGQSTLVPDREVLVGFYLPLANQGQASAFQRVMRPQGVALPVLNLAVWVARVDMHIADVRIAVGPAGPTPQRACAVEEFLRGAVYDEATLLNARAVWDESMRFRTSPQRATAGYRRHLSRFLLEDVLSTAWQRAAEIAGQPVDGLEVR